MRQPQVTRRRKRTREECIGIAEMKRARWVRRVLIAKHGGRCHLCNEQVELHDETSPRYASADHVVPLSRGGADALANLALACRGCNRAKGNQVDEGSDDDDEE